MSSKSLALSFSLLTTLSIATGTARADQCAWNTEPIDG